MLPYFDIEGSGQFFTLESSKIEVSETYFFDIVTTGYDHPRYVKHDLGHIYVCFTSFRYWVPGGGLPRDWHTTCICSFSRRVAQNFNLMCVTVKMVDLLRKSGLRAGSYSMHAWPLTGIPLDRLA